MVYFDGIIYTWHGEGGIGVYFRELMKYLRLVKFPHLYYSYREDDMSEFSQHLKKRKLERYRSFDRAICDGVFHSTYYRTTLRKTIPVVTTVHDFTYEKTIKGPRKWVHSWQKFNAIRRSDFVICVSNNTKADFFEFFPNYPVDRVTTIHNGVSKTFRPVNDDLQICDYPFVLFVGSRGRYKNFSLAVEAIRKVKDLNFYCVGGGGFSKEEVFFLQRTIPGRFRHLGYVTDEELNCLYNKAHCLLYPSEYEGFGIPVVEAMRAGCPVVALNKTSIPEVAGNCAILLDDSSPESISAAIHLLFESDTRSDMVKKGKLRANGFSWDKMGEETLAVYESILSK